jgi:hypothetical protein
MYAGEDRDEVDQPATVDLHGPEAGPGQGGSRLGRGRQDPRQGRVQLRRRRPVWRVRQTKKGIIDPAKLVRCALLDAASVAGLLLTTEAMVAEVPKKVSAPAMPPGPARYQHGTDPLSSDIHCRRRIRQRLIDEES